jgi:branched-chain amino acid transport system substrate-binding protein
VSTFGAHAWDAGMLLQTAIPVALKSAKPGTKEFRVALRDALEGIKNAAGAHGIFNMSANDHLGLDQRAAVMVQIHDGKWVMQK